MKYIITLFVVLNFTIHAQTNDWKTIDKPNYQIKYPSTWTADLSGKMNATFFLFAPLEGNTDKFSENINLLIQDVSAYNLDLDAYTKISVDQIKKLITNSSLIESRKVKTANGEHQKVVYTGDQNGMRLKFEQYYWVIKNKAYVLTLTTDISTFETYKKTGEAIMDTFKIK